jgi:hypothetical protein
MLWCRGKVRRGQAGGRVRLAHQRIPFNALKILELIGRPKGATVAELTKAVAWQAHSLRAFLSTASRKHGLKIESTKTEAGDRVYQIKK